MRKAIVMMGLPLSGKTTWINENVNPEEYFLVSADNIKMAHPDYDPENTEMLHEYSVREAEAQINRLSAEGHCIIMDGGGINNTYTVGIMDDLKRKGYTIRLVHVRSPHTICLERNKRRVRKVPNEAIITKAIRETAQFHRLRGVADTVEVVEYFTNKHIFVDMDGVIAALSTLPIINGEIDFVNSEIYKYLKPVTPVIEKLRGLMGMGYIVYILSAIPNSFSYHEKNEWLDTHFNIPNERRFFVNQGKHKAEMLENLSVYLKVDKRDIVIVEDIHTTLYDVKARYMNSMHVLEFLIHDFPHLNHSELK